jgi:hypothetical protein
MIDVFYFIGLLLILIDILILSKYFKYVKIDEWVTKYAKVTGKIVNRQDFKEGDFELFIFYKISLLFNFLWLFCGIITRDWIVFISTLSILLLIDIIINKIGKFTIYSKMVKFTRSFLLLCLMLFLVLNHFHLHISLLKYH